MLRIRLLGHVGVLTEDGEIGLGGPQPRAALALLALASPRAVGATQIIDGLWGEDPPASARNAVQVMVTRLRKALEPYDVSVERVGDGYALRGALLVDVARFEELVSAGRTALRAGEVASSAGLLGEALRLWEGAPLAGTGDVPFVEAHRRALETVRISALVDLGEAQLRLGDPSSSARTMEGLLAEHPFDERGWIGLATAQYWAGRQDEALATCRRARERLLDELGIDPTPALEETERRILRHELVDRTPTAEEAPAGGAPGEHLAASLPAPPASVVGREGLVEDVLGRLRSGVRLVSLVGLGGIGKTTLALVVAHRLERAVFCSLETEADVLAAWGRVCRTLGVDPEDDPVAAIAGVADGTVLLLDNVEQVAGIGVALDDLLTRAPGLAVLVTSRRPTAARQEHVVQVPPLDPGSAESMFREQAERVRPGIGAADPDAVPRLCRLLDGIPLALELAAGRVRTLTPHQLLGRIESRRASVLDGSAAVAVPDRHASLHGVLTEAYDTLTPNARSLFELLGSVDGWISVELLESAAEGWVPEYLDALDELTGCGLVSLDLEGRASMRVPVREFARALGRRAELDARLRAAVLRLVRDAAPRLVGEHTADALALLARDDDPLGTALTRAVEAADVQAGAALALGLSRYWLLTGRLTEGRALIERVQALPGHGTEDAARVALLSGTFASYFGDPDTPARLDAALAAAAGLPVDRLVVNAWCCLAAHTAHHGDFEAADRAARGAAEAAARSGDPALVGLARDVEGHVASYLRDYQRAFDAKLSGLAEARRSGDLYDVINLLTGASDDLLLLGRVEESLAYVDEAFELTGAFDPGPLLSHVLLMRGVVLAASGRIAAARGSLLAALRLIRDRRPDPLAIADALYALGACAAQDLQDTEALRCYGAADALYGEHRVEADERLAAPLLEARDALRTRLGPERVATLSALGSTDPDRTVDRLLQGDLAGLR